MNPGGIGVKRLLMLEVVKNTANVGGFNLFNNHC